MEINLQGIKFGLMILSLVLFNIDNPNSILPDAFLVSTLIAISTIEHKQQNSKISFYIWSGISSIMMFCFLIKAFIL